MNTRRLAKFAQSVETLTVRTSLTRLLDCFSYKMSESMLKAPRQNLIEPLEPRQMLSTITHPHTGLETQGEFHTFTAKSSAGDRTFIDDQNNKVFFTLSGAGTGTIFQADSGEIVSLGLTDTKSVTNLIVNVTKGKGGTGYTTFAEIQVDEGGMNAFKAANVNLTRSFTSEDAIKSLTLGDIKGNFQASITIGGEYIDKTTMILGALDDVSIRTSSNITSFKAQDWQDNDDFQDSLEAASLGSLSITGRTQVKSKSEVIVPALAGDFEATINLTYVVPIGTAPNSPAAKPKVNTIAIAGSTFYDWAFKAHSVSSIAIKAGATGAWTSSAGFGSITIAGPANQLRITSTQDIGSFKAGRVSSSTLDAKGTIGAVNTIEFLDGFIAASKVSSIATTGKAAVVNKGGVVTPAIAGDFSADMLINNILGTTSPTAPSVGSVNIKGSAIGDISHKGLTNLGDWIIAGGVGAIKIGGDMETLFIDVRAKETNKGNIGSVTIDGFTQDSRIDSHGKSGAIKIAGAQGLVVVVGEGVSGGDLAGFTSTKAIENVTLDVRGTITSINTTSWHGGLIDARKIGTITSKSTKDITADWDVVSLNITGVGLKTGQASLGQVNIAGQVNASIWHVAGNAGSVSVGAFFNSTLYVGIKGASTSSVALNQSDFTITDGKASTLAGFTVTGNPVTSGHASFSNSHVAAGTLAKVSLKLVNTASLNAYGFSASTKVGVYSRQTGPKTVVRVNNQTQPNTYDTAGLYTLKIVDTVAEAM